MNRWPVTLVVAIKNCEDRVGGTLSPWLGRVREIIVVDDESKDQGARIAKDLGAKVFVRAAPNGNFDLNRKFGIEQATTPWVLYVDTDERPTGGLITELERFFELGEDSKFFGVKIPNDFYFLGKKLTAGIYQPSAGEIRLFRKENYAYPCEAGLHRGIEVNGSVHSFQNSYRHFNVNSLSEWFLKTNQYTEVDSLKYRGPEVNLSRAVFNFIRFFLKHYFWRRGYEDGVHGLLSCLYFGFYHFTQSAKNWEKTYLKTREEDRDYLKPIRLPER